MPIAPLSRRLAPLRPLGDALIAAFALFVAFRIRIELPLPMTTGTLPAERLVLFEHALPWLIAGQLALLALMGLYEAGRPLARLELVRRLLFVVGLQAFAGAAAIFLGNLTFPRSVLLLYALVDAPLLYLFRRLLDRLHRIPVRRVILVGCGPTAREVAASLAEHHFHGLVVVGHVPVPGEAAPVETVSGEVVSGQIAPGESAPELGPLLGTVEELPGLLADGLADDLLLAPGADTWQNDLIDRLAGVRPPHASVLLVPGPFESLIGRMRYRWVSDLPVIEVVRESEWRLRRPGKRLFDLVAGALMALAAAPVALLGAAAVAVTSRGPVLHRQRRIGLGQAPFEIWKLRTMRLDAEAAGEELMAAPDDPRLTPIGGLLRRYRVDELPQLAQVLSGKMSLVGPRPERPGFVQRYLAEVPGYRERFSVPPGLTGLAQVNGEYDSSAGNKLRYDLAYIANWSVWLDLSILIRTVRIVLTSRGV